MIARATRMFAVAALVAGTLTGLTAAASATLGPGTFTRITTPSHDTTFKYNGNIPTGSNTFTVAGVTSNDVTAVEIDCLLTNAVGIQAFPFATNVHVSGGSFSTTAAYPTLTGNCRLRAIPTGVDYTTDYLGSFTGPILYTNTVAIEKDGSTPIGYVGAGEQGDGLGEVQDAGECGIAALATITTPEMQLHGSATSESCLLELASNLTGSASAIRVDGHNAYLPHVVYSLLRNGQALTLPQPSLTTSSQRFSNGDITISETAQLKRCNGDNTYPPTSGSCASLLNTGVQFKRVLNIFRGAHQIRIRDSFTSTNGVHHTVAAQYQMALPAPAFGALGYMFPGRNTFHQAQVSQTVTGLGSKAATMFVRSDIYASSDDLAANTFGFTWSRAPSKVQFSSASVQEFALQYSLSVPAHGAAYLGFADSEAPLTTTAKNRAAVAVREIVSRPSISSPGNGATLHAHTTTVKGSVMAGANGLPTSVVVNGRAAHLRKVSATKETYKVSFSESFGKHMIKVTARDVAGNTKAKSITVKNVAP